MSFYSLKYTMDQHGHLTQHTQQVVPLTHSILPMLILTDWYKYFDKIPVS